jgi:hypothetical protein
VLAHCSTARGEVEDGLRALEIPSTVHVDARDRAGSMLLSVFMCEHWYWPKTSRAALSFAP